jgi:hypothetical protein
MRCVTTQKSVDLIYIVTEAWNKICIWVIHSIIAFFCVICMAYRRNTSVWTHKWKHRIWLVKDKALTAVSAICDMRKSCKLHPENCDKFYSFWRIYMTPYVYWIQYVVCVFRVFCFVIVWHYLTFTGPCSIAIYLYSKSNQMHQYLNYILFWNNSLHVSDGLFVHHQEFKTVHTATGILQTRTAACLLAGTSSDICQTGTAACLLAGRSSGICQRGLLPAC